MMKKQKQQQQLKKEGRREQEKKKERGQQNEQQQFLPPAEHTHVCVTFGLHIPKQTEVGTSLILSFSASLPPSPTLSLCVRFVYTLLLELGISFVNYKEICCCTQRFVPCACVGVRRVCFAACMAERKDRGELVGGC